MDGNEHSHAVTSRVLLQCRPPAACCKLEHLLLLTDLGNKSGSHRQGCRIPCLPGGLKHAKADAACQKDKQPTWRVKP